MDIDVPENQQAPVANQQTTETDSGEASLQPTEKTETSKQIEKTDELDMDALYPVFWGLQAHFSAPTQLFDAEKFASFKSGIEATLTSFRKVSADLQGRGMSKGTEDSRRGLKRKRNGDPSGVTNNFNPKYLTSRDLFELEVTFTPDVFSFVPITDSVAQVNDVAFRRHILVQALISLNFLLSLSPMARAKLSGATNKSVLYGYVLNEEDVSLYSIL